MFRTLLASFTLILATMTISINTQQFEIPPIWSQQRENIRMYEIRQLNEPQILLNKVYKRQVYKVNNLDNDSNSTIIDDFQVCKQSPPEISFKNIGYYRLDQPISPYSDTQQVTNSTEISRKTNTVIYDFQVLKNKYQNIIDMVHYEGHIFTISSTANLSVYAMTNDENGIQLRNNLKGIDWDDLYKYRYQTWLHYENKEKQRQDLIEKQKNKTISGNTTNNSSTDNQNNTNTIGQQGNDTLINPPLPSQQNKNNTTPRLLQSSPPSPKVYQDKKPTKQQTNDSSNTDNASNKQQQPSQSKQQQIYYTGPPPQAPKPHVQKGYFQLMDNNKLLIFANNEYLIAYDINKNWCFLLSQQPSYEHLFAKKQAEKDQQQKSNDTAKKADVSDNDTANGNSTNSTSGGQSKSISDKKQVNVTTDSTNNKLLNNKQGSKQQNVSNSTNSTKSTKSQQKQQQPDQPITIPDPQPIIPPEYVPMPYFEQITKINQTHFALIDKKTGIYIYQIQQQKPQNFTSYSNNPSNYFLKMTAFLGKQQFGKLFQEHEELNLVDISFYHNKSLLLVLDYEKGVFAFQQRVINSNNNSNNSSSTSNSTTITNKTQNTQNPTTQQPFTLSPYTIIKKMCYLMQFSQQSQQLFLSCNKIYRISLRNWPIISQKIYPHPLINIREIYIEQQMDIIILSGYSVFKVMYLDRTANYFQDDMLDKIVFNKDMVITANQNHIIALRYIVEKPAIVCQSHNRSLLGMHNVLLRTTAECSQPYLKAVNFTMPQNYTLNQDDICVYNIYKTIYIWQQGEVPLKPLAIVMLVFLIFICVMIIWFILIKFRMQRAQQHLRYLGEQGHKTLVQQQQQQQKKSVILQKQLQQSEQINPDEVNKQSDISINTDEQDHNKDLYSIQ